MIAWIVYWALFAVLLVWIGLRLMRHPWGRR